MFWVMLLWTCFLIISGLSMVFVLLMVMWWMSCVELVLRLILMSVRCVLNGYVVFGVF